MSKQKKSKNVNELRVCYLDNSLQDIEEFTDTINTSIFQSFIGTSSIDEVIKLVSNDQIDLLVCDFRMPRMNGIEVLSKCHQISSNIEMVLFTGFVMNYENIKICNQLGIHRIKKIDIGNLVGIISYLTDFSGDLYNKKKSPNLIKPEESEVTEVKDKGVESINIIETKFLNLPIDLIESVQQYFLFFSRYVEVSKNKRLKVELEEQGADINVLFELEEDFEMEELKSFFLEYINIAKDKMQFGEVEVVSDIVSANAEKLMSELRKEISDLKTSLEVAKSNNKVLGSHNDFLENLALSFANKTIKIENISNMKIENQNIFGGNQQFADTIINSSPNLNDTDRAFVQLIHDNTSSEEERKELIESLETVKSDDPSENEKKKSSTLLRKFLESGVSEAGKNIAKTILESGFENLL